MVDQHSTIAIAKNLTMFKILLRSRTNMKRIDGASLCEDQQIVLKSLMSSQWMDNKIVGGGGLVDQEYDCGPCCCVLLQWFHANFKIHHKIFVVI